MGKGIYHGGGQIALVDALFVQTLEGHTGIKDLGGSLAAEENDPLVKDSQAADLHGAGGAHKGVGGDAVEVADIHSVEPAIEAHGLHIDVHIQQLGRAGFHADGPVNGALGTLRGIKA